jgi:hypothetical protein
MSLRLQDLYLHYCMSAAEVVESGKHSAANDAVNAEDVRLDTSNDEDKEQAAPTDNAIGEQDSDDAKQQGDQLETSRTICGCACSVDCNCRCTCACAHHCVCRIRPCDKKCGDRFSRNLVISIDGTSNQFGIYVSPDLGPHLFEVLLLTSFFLRAEHQRRGAPQSD